MRRRNRDGPRVEPRAGLAEIRISPPITSERRGTSNLTEYPCHTHCPDIATNARTTRVAKRTFLGREESGSSACAARRLIEATRATTRRRPSTRLERVNRVAAQDETLLWHVRRPPPLFDGVSNDAIDD